MLGCWLLVAAWNLGTSPQNYCLVERKFDTTKERKQKQHACTMSSGSVAGQSFMKVNTRVKMCPGSVLDTN